MIDLSTFEKAIEQVEEALSFCRSDMSRNDPRLALHLRAASIQAFEFTYELAVKILKRFLETLDPNPSAIDEMTFNDLVRRGYEIGGFASRVGRMETIPKRSWNNEPRL